MSSQRPLHPVPRGGIDPIRSEGDALAVLALAAPYGHDTIALLLDHRRCGYSILIVNDTTDPDSMFAIIDSCVSIACDVDILDGVILATSRPGGDAEADDVHRWLEASDQCEAGGLTLVEWFVIGRYGPTCPREQFGEPDRWLD